MRGSHGNRAAQGGRGPRCWSCAAAIALLASSNLALAAPPTLTARSHRVDGPAGSPDAGSTSTDATPPPPSDLEPPSDELRSDGDPQGSPDDGDPSTEGASIDAGSPEAGAGNEPAGSRRRKANAAAKAELEGGDLSGAGAASAPPRMEKMQRAAWWTLFGALTVSAGGGVLAGFAEREEDRVERLMDLYDPDTGGAPNYASIRDEYETAERRGGQFAWASRGLLIAGGATLVASIVLFGVHSKRVRAKQQAGLPTDIELRPRQGKSAKLRLLSPTAVELKF